MAGMKPAPKNTTPLKHGVVFAFDGPDGIGKTTQVRLASESLQKQGYDVEVRRLMGGTPIGEKLRDIIFSDAVRPIETDLHIALAVYYALGAELVKLREEGKIILLDRSPLSIIAYQSFGSGLPKELGYATCDETLQVLRPELILLYEAPFEVLSSRRHGRAPHENDNYFENQQLAFHRRTIEGYAEAAERYKIAPISATGTIDDMHTATMARITKYLAGL
jgi:dTMP kinase